MSSPGDCILWVHINGCFQVLYFIPFLLIQILHSFIHNTTYGQRNIWKSFVGWANFKCDTKYTNQYIVRVALHTPIPLFNKTVLHSVTQEWWLQCIHNLGEEGIRKPSLGQSLHMKVFDKKCVAQLDLG